MCDFAFTYSKSGPSPIPAVCAAVVLLLSSVPETIITAEAEYKCSGFRGGTAAAARDWHVCEDLNLRISDFHKRRRLREGYSRSLFGISPNTENDDLKTKIDPIRTSIY